MGAPMVAASSERTRAMLIGGRLPVRAALIPANTVWRLERLQEATERAWAEGRRPAC